MKKTSWWLAMAAAVALTGCFGGNDDDTPAATASVPQSASDSPGGFISYLQRLVVISPEGLEPVDVSAVTAPQDDTSEPTVVN